MEGVDKIMAKKKHYNYFEKFVELIDYSCQCADILHDTLLNFNAVSLDNKVAEIHTIEHTADLAFHDMMKHLAQEFIAPIEREDIITLARRIDDITDSIEDVLIKMHMFNLKSVKPEVLKFTEIIVKSCYSLKVIMEEFAHYKKSTLLKDKIIEVNSLEEEGDRLYYSTIRNLFATSKDPIEILVWTKIYNNLEYCYDVCEETADTVELVIMKNS